MQNHGEEVSTLIEDMVGSVQQPPFAFGPFGKAQRKTEPDKPKLKKQNSLSSELDREEAWERKRDLPSKLKKENSLSSELDRQEAWERKRDLHLRNSKNSTHGVVRSVSDCGERLSTEKLQMSNLRACPRSLTDEDMEELRGCIDLGFGFSSDASYDLRNTLPALDLYCAINKQFEDIKSGSSPVSPLDATTATNGSLTDSWIVSGPDDDPDEVKTRLRHWAQAVACSVKQCLSP